jgi:hypothetical protein
VRFGDDAKFPARYGKRLVDSRCATVDDDQAGTISREQTAENLLREVVASPVPIARD